MRTRIKCDYGKNFRNLSFPCTEKKLQIFCDSLALPDEAGTQIHFGRVYDRLQMDALLMGNEMSPTIYEATGQL